MVYTILTDNSCPCALEEFVINGITADLSDFGSTCHPTAHGCSCIFSPKKPEKEILDKYHITLHEYKMVTDRLKKALSIMPCDFCM